MSVPFGSGKNPYQSQGAIDDAFIRPKIEFEFQVKKTINDISLFDITSEDELNDRGKKLTSDELFADITPQFDGPKWLGLTGKGSFGDEKPLLQTSFLKSPPKPFDRDGNPVKRKDDPDSDCNWNTFA